MNNSKIITTNISIAFSPLDFFSMFTKIFIKQIKNIKVSIKVIFISNTKVAIRRRIKIAIQLALLKKSVIFLKKSIPLKKINRWYKNEKIYQYMFNFRSFS